MLMKMKISIKSIMLKSRKIGKTTVELKISFYMVKNNHNKYKKESTNSQIIIRYYPFRSI